jgi:type VI secretion system VasD/TssJ family lipoprotein
VIVIRVFRLADPGAFQKAGYEELFEKDEKTLGTDLVGTVDILIEPGSKETFNRVLTDRDRYLGFVVTYRDSATAQWRALIPLRPRSTTKVDLEVGARGVIASTVEG